MKRMRYFRTVDEAPAIMSWYDGALEMIDPFELQLKINRFKRRDFQFISEKEIKRELDDVLSVVCASEEKVAALNLRYKILLDKNRLFRIRKFVDLNTLLEQMRLESSYWNPHPKYIKTYGRLNRPGKSLLYTAEEPLIALREMDVKEGDWFVLITYTNTMPIRVWSIEPQYDHIAFSNDEPRKMQILQTMNKFLVELFTMDVLPGQEYLYKITESIVSEWYASSYTNWGWSYPSVKDTTMYNLCLDPECFKYSGGIRNVMKFSGAFVCRKEIDSYISVHRVVRGV